MLAQAEQMIQEHYPGAEIERSSVTVAQLARRGGPTPTMQELSIGSVWRQSMARSFAMVDIWLDREGYMSTRPRMPSGE